MELSKRLEAVASLVSDGSRLADIGTDHAYIPIRLVREGRIPSAVAMDVNRGPLDRAGQNIRNAGYEDRIQIRLSDGFSALCPGEADCAVLAGMGGGLVIRILRQGMETVRTLKECILQPQSEIKKVRTFLLEEGFFFMDETMVKEDGKYYPMMKVIPPGAEKRKKNDPWTETELRYGKLLLWNKNKVLQEYLQREIRIRKQLIERLEAENTKRASSRLEELKEEMIYAEKGLNYYAL